MHERELLMAKQVAKLLDVSRRTIYRWLKTGSFPQPIKLSPGTVRWRRAELQAFIASQGGQTS